MSFIVLKPAAVAALLLSVVPFIAVMPAAAAERVFVQTPATVEPSAAMPEKVSAECPVEARISHETLFALTKRGFTAEPLVSAEKAGSDKVVYLTIIGISGEAGGAWSGRKSINVKVELKQGSTLLKSKVLTRASGVMGSFWGTCSLLDKVTTALGRDSAKWVAREINNPGAGRDADAKDSATDE